MITSDDQLTQTVEQLTRMYRALAALKAEVLPVNPQRFALMAEGPLDQIRSLQAELDAYGAREAVEDQEADVWMRLVGPNIVWPETPISVLTAFLDNLRKGVQTVAEFLARGRLGVRPTAELKRTCDLRVMAFRPGSLRLGMRVPENVQMQLPMDQQGTAEALPQQALSDYLAVAAWVGSDQEIGVLSHRFNDPAHLRLLLNALKGFVPRPRGEVEYVELSGRRVPAGQTIRLTRQVHERIDQAIDQTVAQRAEQHEGDLREIDLDALTFTLRNIDGIQQVACEFEEDLLESAKKALDRRVRVSGTRTVQEGRRGGGKLHVTRLEVLEDLPGDSSPPQATADDSPSN
jgi:hypothetical protein